MTDFLLLDEWSKAAMDSHMRADLLEIIDDRVATKVTIITSQLPIEYWHAWVGDAATAGVVLDRLMQRHHRFTLTGKSLRQVAKASKQERNSASSLPINLNLSAQHFTRCEQSRWTGISGRVCRNMQHASV